MMNEYEMLRGEIKDWQDRRFTILTASVGLVTAILSLKVFDEPVRTELWPSISALLLLLLTCACALTWYAGRANAKIAAYLIVFHERSSQSGEGWESRLDRLNNSGFDHLNLNRLMFCIYLVLGLVAMIPVLRHFPIRDGWNVLIIPIALFVCSLLLLVLPSPKDRYIKQWESPTFSHCATPKRPTNG